MTELDHDAQFKQHKVELNLENSDANEYQFIFLLIVRIVRLYIFANSGCIVSFCRIIKL
jgi:hypothetical protein